MISDLWVDDESDSFDLAEYNFEQTGHFTTDEEASPGIGLEIHVPGMFDVIVSDYWMPVVDGIQYPAAAWNRDLMIPFTLAIVNSRESIAIDALAKEAEFFFPRGMR